MDPKEYEIAIDRTNQALSHLQERHFCMTPDKMLLLGIALRYWICVPASLGQGGQVTVLFHAMGERIIDDLIRQDPRLGTLWAVCRDWEKLSKYSAGRAIVDRATEQRLPDLLPPARRDYMLEVVAQALTGFFMEVLIDDMEMENPWKALEGYMESAIKQSLASTNPLDCTSDHPLWLALSGAEHQIVREMVLQQSA